MIRPGTKLRSPGPLANTLLMKTMAPINKCLNLYKNYLNKSKIKFPLPNDKIIKVYTNQCFFKFNEKFYKHTFVQLMGSPLSEILACLFVEYLLTCTCIGFHPGRVEPASFRASTGSRTIAAHVRRSGARSHEMASQSLFHCRRPTTWGPRSSLNVLAHFFSNPPTRFRQLQKEEGG